MLKNFVVCTLCLCVALDPLIILEKIFKCTPLKVWRTITPPVFASGPHDAVSTHCGDAPISVNVLVACLVRGVRFALESPLVTIE